jgi:hypothetical protein
LMDPSKGPSTCLSSPQRLAAHNFASALIRFRQRHLVAAFEGLRWNRIASSVARRVPNRTSSTKALPSSLFRCKRTADELRRQLSVCKEALRSSDDVAERLLLGKRLLPRCQRQPVEPVDSEKGLTPSASSNPPKGRIDPEGRVEPATVWHPPGNEDEANWKELALLVDGLREENPKWAACLAHVVQRLEASHTACRRQRDSLVEATKFPAPQANAKPEINDINTKEAEEAELASYSLATDFRTDEIIFAGYGKLSPTEVSSGLEPVDNSAPGAEREGNSMSGHNSLSNVHAYPASETDVVTLLVASPERPVQAVSALSSPQRLPPGSLSSSQNSGVGMAVGPPQRAPPRVPQPLVPSVQISLLADRGVPVELARQASTDNPSTSTDTSSEDSQDTSGHDRSTRPTAGHLGTLVADPSCPIAPERELTPSIDERQWSSAEQMAPPPDRLPAQGKSPRVYSDSMQLSENIKLSSKFKEILGAKLPRVVSQNGVEAVGTAVSSSSAPVTCGHQSSGSLSVGLGTTSGSTWPQHTLYTPRQTVGSLQAMPRGAAAEEGDRQDGLVDNLSRSAASLLSNPYTPRHKTTTRIGVAPLRNQQASRTGSLRYPPSSFSRPFAVQRMSSGTLGQPSTPQPSGVAPSPRQMSGTVTGGTVPAPKRTASMRTPSLSASPARTAGHSGYQGPSPQQNQWPSVARAASVVAPTAVTSKTGSLTHSITGVSRQSSVERPSSAIRPPAPSPFPASTSSTWMQPETYTQLSAVPEPIRRTSVASTGGGANLAGSATGPIGSGTSVPSVPRTSPAVPKLPMNGITAYTKGAPPPQTSMPTNTKGYSSIQLWTPRSQAQAGSDAKQAAVPREARELSIEPPQVGRSPSASLSMSPRAYQGMSIPNTGGQSALLTKLSAWRA